MNIWIINQYASTALMEKAGRHYDLSRHLVRLGHEVTVISARCTHLVRDRAAVLAAPETQVVDGVRYHLIDTLNYAHAHDRRRILGWFVFAWKLRGLDRHLGGRPDVVIYSSPSLVGYLGAEGLARKLGAKLVFEVRDVWPLSLTELGGYSSSHPFIRMLQWIEDRAYRNADAVISNLPLAEDHMLGRGLTPGKFHWIANGIDVEIAERGAPLPSELLKRIPAGGFRLVYAGTFGVANALDVLIDAMALIKDQSDIYLILAGHGKEQVRLQARVNELDLRSVIFLGIVPKNQVQSLLAVASACYVGLLRTPIYRYGVALNKLFDYLLAGKPIIYCGDSGRYRPIEDWQAGVTVHPEEPAALADAIIRLRNLNEAKRLAMGENGSRAVREIHDYRHIAEKLATVLKGLR